MIRPIRVAGWWVGAIGVALVTGAAAMRASAGASEDPLARGAYLARAADCVSCHTSQDGAPYAGGRPIDTPFGTVYSSNLTPDATTGIGGWTEEQFYRAVHDGIRPDGSYLYPVMPFTFYARMPRRDINAIYQYLQSVPAQRNAVRSDALRFPYDIRDTMAAWRELYFHPHVFVPDPAHSAAWNRGAYLVNGPGHCGACHSPRTELGGIRADDRLSGALVEHWFAPNLTSSLRTGLGTWSEADIVDFLQTGVAPDKGSAVGPMLEVVHNSLSHLREADLEAIAVYLKALPPEGASPPAAAHAAHGARLYVDNCMACHRPGGAGVPGVVPALKGNSLVNADNPADVMDVVLQGVPARGRFPAMPAFANRLTDAEIAELLDYVRSSWGNSAPENVTPSLVGVWRGYLTPADGHAAAGLECPRASSSGKPGTGAPSEAELAQVEADLQGGDEGERIGYAIRRLEQRHPDWTYGKIADTLLAAYCPVVARLGLGPDDEALRLQQFAKVMREALVSNHVRLSLAPERAYPTIPEVVRSNLVLLNPPGARRAFSCAAAPATDRRLVDALRTALAPYREPLLTGDMGDVAEILSAVRGEHPHAASDALIADSAYAFCPAVAAATPHPRSGATDYDWRVSTWMRFVEKVAQAERVRE